VGSLLKPAIYLTALEQGDYNLATLIPDEPVSLPQSNGSIWEPENYDGEIHGQVSMLMALSSSYNLAAVNLGLTLGVDKIVDTVQSLGYDGDILPYPAMMLGSKGMSPYEVTQLYQTLADDGFYTPLRAVREVITQKGRPLQRYPIQTEQRFKPQNAALVKFALQNSLYQGTGRHVGARLTNRFLAGKTGTTDDLRDSWFAGFGQDYVSVVWLGNDDNRVTGLTGSSGALKVWGELMQRITRDEAAPALMPGLELVGVDLDSGLLGDEGCEQYSELPFVEGTAPEEFADCASVQSAAKSRWQGIKEWFR